MARKNPKARKIIVFAGGAVALYFLYRQIAQGKRKRGRRAFNKPLRNLGSDEARRRIRGIMASQTIADFRRAQQGRI